MTEKELAGRTAIITGGATGIGFAAARAIASAGAAVHIAGIDAAAVDDAVQQLTSDGLTAQGHTVDVRDRAAVRELIGGPDRLDILVNSAGIQRYGTVLETSEELWDEVLDINLKGAFLTSKYAVARMSDGGAIVNVASVQSIATQTGVLAYSTSKAGLLGLTRALAVDHARAGIRVNAVCPGSVNTPMLRWGAEQFADEQSTAEQLLHDWGEMHPIGRVAEPDEVGNVIAFLAGPRASFVTGAEVKVDGGLLATIGVALPE